MAKHNVLSTASKPFSLSNYIFFNTWKKVSYNVKQTNLWSCLMPGTLHLIVLFVTYLTAHQLHL